MLMQIFMLLAEAGAAGGVSTADIGPAISTVGSLGFAVWYAWYVTTVVIPKLMADHRAERLELLTAHRAERVELQTRFDKSLLDIRTAYDTDVQSLLAELKEQRLQFTQWLTEKKAG